MRKIFFVLLLTAAGTAVAGGAAHADAGQPSQNQNQPKTHIVVEGESLSSIAADNNLPSWMPIWDANTNVTNPDVIVPGEQLVIPQPPYPATDRPLPAGYGAPVPSAVQSAPAAAAVHRTAVSYHPAPAPVYGDPGGLAHRVCLRESGCNYATNTGNGYSGAYQFDNATWGNFGGYAAAYLAPPAVQDQKFQETYARRGCSPWPNTCY